MKTTIKEITPQWAEHILDTKNPNNRPINAATVNSYASDMRAGHWLLTPQTIAFNESGDLMDGQHRLAAVVASKVAIKSLVVTGVPAVQKNGISLNTMDVIDRHRVRGIGQQLSLSHGWGNGNRVASIARGIALFYSSSAKGLKITTPQTLAILGTCEASVRAMMKCSHLSTGRANGKVLGAAAIYHTKHPQKATEFMDSYLTTIGWTKGCPQKALDVWRTHNPVEMNSGRGIAMHAAAAALFYFHKQEPVQIIRVNAAATAWLSNLNAELRDAVKAQIQ